MWLAGSMALRGGLTRRTIMASGLVALLVGAGYALLLRAVIVERDSARRALASQEVLTVANTLERLVLDLETGQRGFLITREERFLEPWKTARAEYPRIAAELRRLASGPAQKTRAERIAAEIDSYVHDYSIPLLRRERSGTRPASGPATLDDGKRRVDDIRAAFDGFFADE